VFEFLFYLGILGVTLSFYSYALHLYEFNSLILSNLTLSSIIALYLMSFNVISYLPILQRWELNTLQGWLQGWGLFALYFIPLFLGSWALLYIGESIRLIIFADKRDPILTKERPGVSGAFAMMLIVVAFIAGNTLIASGEFSTSNSVAGNAELNGDTLSNTDSNSGLPNLNDPKYSPVVILVQNFFAEQSNPQLAQEDDTKVQQQWDTGMSLFESGYLQCSENSTAVLEMPSLNSDNDKTALCDGIHRGVSDLNESGVCLSGISGSTGFALSKKSSSGLLLPIIEQLSGTCQNSETLCRQAKIAIQNNNNDQFQNNLNEIQSNLRQMKMDYNEGEVFIEDNSTQS
jgi:hypothetical protein